MKCPKCQSENPDESAYCARCGTRLFLEGDVSHTKTIQTPREELTTASTFAGRYQIIPYLPL